MGQYLNVDYPNRVYLRAQYLVHSSSSFILMTLNLKPPVLFAFLLMILCPSGQYILSMLLYYILLYNILFRYITRRYIQVAVVGKYMSNGI